MTYVTKIDGAWVLVYPGVPFVDATGISRPGNWLDLSSDKEKADARVYALPEPAAPPAGKVEVSRVPSGKDRPVWSVTYEDAPAPPAPYVPDVISDRQFAQVLALDGVISQDEALAWAARGDLPARLTDALEQIPEDDGARFGAKMMLSAATTYERNHPLVPTLGALLGMDDAALDNIWRTGATL